MVIKKETETPPTLDTTQQTKRQPNFVSAILDEPVTK